MLQRDDVRRPAQVNACFEGGTSQREEIVSSLREVGLEENQITVIDRPDPEDTRVATAEPTFFERIKEMFGGEEREEVAHNYDLLVLAHLGQNEGLAAPVQEIFQRYNAARVNYYPSAEVEMHPLGGGEVSAATTEGHERIDHSAQVPDSGTASAASLTGVASGTTPANTTPGREYAAEVAAGVAAARDDDARVEPGGLSEGTTTRVTNAGDRAVDEEEIVFRGNAPGVKIVDQTTTRGSDATGGTTPTGGTRA